MFVCRQMPSCSSTIVVLHCAIVLSWLLCQRSIDYIYENLFLGTLFCSTVLFLYSFTKSHCLGYGNFTVCLAAGEWQSSGFITFNHLFTVIGKQCGNKLSRRVYGPKEGSGLRSGINCNSTPSFCDLRHRLTT